MKLWVVINQLYNKKLLCYVATAVNNLNPEVIVKEVLSYGALFIMAIPTCGLGFNCYSNFLDFQQYYDL